MTEPNQFSQSDILAARELVKSRNHPAHYKNIDDGLWDNFQAMRDAMAEIIRCQKEGQEDE